MDAYNGSKGYTSHMAAGAEVWLSGRGKLVASIVILIFSMPVHFFFQMLIVTNQFDGGAQGSCYYICPST